MLGPSLRMKLEMKVPPRGPEACSPKKSEQKWCDLVHSERSKVCYYQPKNQQF